MKLNGNSRIEVLDTIRAFSALSVCLFHFVCTTKGFIDSTVIRSIFSVGKYGVQSFFVISGFVIPWSMYHGGYKLKFILKFLMKRFIRLEPPYLISIGFAILFLFIRNKYYVVNEEELRLSGDQILLHFGYLIPLQQTHEWLNSVYWTLAIEFQYYFFMTLAFLLLNGIWVKGRWFVYIIGLGGTFLGSDQFLPFWLPFFLLGMLVFLFKTEKIRYAELILMLVLTGVLIYFRYPLFALIFSLVPVVSILFCDQLKIIVLHRIGKFSYSLYLFHSIVGAAFVNVASHYVENWFYKSLTVIFGLVISVVAAAIVNKFIEKPSQQLSSSIKY
jgi:peptidoglycan/LPS O-acetylase OafA/YrhL